MLRYEFVTCSKCNRAIVLILVKRRIWLVKPDGQWGRGCTHARKCIGKDDMWYKNKSNSIRRGAKIKWN